jgi:hypothetical protein
MMMQVCSLIPRPKFSLKTLLWLMAVVAAFLAGEFWQKRTMIAHGWAKGIIVRELRTSP